MNTKLDIKKLDEMIAKIREDFYVSLSKIGRIK